MKTILIATLSALATLGSVNASAASTPRHVADVQDNIRILSAKIENAIADLGEYRTRDDIKNITTQVMDGQDADIGVKTAALNMVIQNAILMEDGEVVGALKSIELETLDLRAAPEVRTDADETMLVQAAKKPKTKKPTGRPDFPLPPAATSNGGSDY